MKPNNNNEHWDENDATWRLLEKAAPKQASGRFADDVLRAVRLLPEEESIWPRILKFSRWSLVAACVVLLTSILIDIAGTDPKKLPGVAGSDVPSHQETPVRVSGKVSTIADSDARWEQIENVAQAELLTAAADHLDDFSDQDLITMIGF